MQFQNQFLRTIGGGGLGVRKMRQEWEKAPFLSLSNLGQLCYPRLSLNEGRREEKKRDLKNEYLWTAYSMRGSVVNILYFV